MPNAHQICREWGIKLYGRRTRYPGTLGNLQCWCRQTIFDVAVKGERLEEPSHIHDVFSLMTASEVNRRMLYSVCISGVSKYLVQHNLFGAEVDKIRERFVERINLEDIRADVEHYGFHAKPLQIALLISVEMEG